MMSQDEKIKHIQKELKKLKEKVAIMEVCGTHTMALAKHGIRSLLPETIDIVSGPGCPVCVTSSSDIENALELARKENVIVATFGDMLKVPSQKDNLSKYKNVKIIYSPIEAIDLAAQNPQKEIALLGIGFETTVPLIAGTILTAKEKKLSNFSVLSTHKIVPPALHAVLSGKSSIKGLILPGHVSVITGRKYFDFLKDYPVSGVVCGFEALEIMESIYFIAKSVNEKKYIIMNNYPKVVTEEGNPLAMKITYNVFEEDDSNWRGVGVIPKSGLKLKKEFDQFDAFKKFGLITSQIPEPLGCLCGEILMGNKKPHQCGHFKKSCTPTNPIGPCMVSSEGTCAAYFKYGVK